MTKSTLQRLANIPADRRESVLLGLGEPELTALLYQWEHWARETQRTPSGDWRVWLILAGRGIGSRLFAMESFAHISSLDKRFLQTPGCSWEQGTE